MRRILSGMLLLAAAGCASRGTAASDQSVTRTASTSRTNIITTDEIRERTSATTAFDLVRQLRPQWSTSVEVFVNNDDFGGFDSSRQISSRDIREIHFYSPSEAQMKFPNHASISTGSAKPVIHIITR